jgi:hypothetical protein
MARDVSGDLSQWNQSLQYLPIVMELLAPTFAGATGHPHRSEFRLQAVLMERGSVARSSFARQNTLGGQLVATGCSNVLQLTEPRPAVPYGVGRTSEPECPPGFGVVARLRPTLRQPGVFALQSGVNLF